MGWAASAGRLGRVRASRAMLWGRRPRPVLPRLLPARRRTARPVSAERGDPCEWNCGRNLFGSIPFLMGELVLRPHSSGGAAPRQPTIRPGAFLEARRTP